MVEIDKEGIEQYQKICNMKSVSRDDVQFLQDYTRKYIDPKCTICKKCKSQIRFAWNRIVNWGKQNNINNLAVNDISPSSDSQVSKTSKVCSCGKEITDKRYKLCQECRDENK